VRASEWLWLLGAACAVAGGGCHRRPELPEAFIENWLRRAPPYDVVSLSLEFDRRRTPYGEWLREGQATEGLREALRERLHREGAKVEPVVVFAIYALKIKGCERDLVSCLASANVQVRAESALGLGVMQFMGAMGELCRLARDEEAGIQGAALMALRMLGGDDARKCVAAATNDAHVEVVQMAKESLDHWGESFTFGCEEGEWQPVFRTSSGKWEPPFLRTPSEVGFR
jgi:hypothetical protein